MKKSMNGKIAAFFITYFICAFLCVLVFTLVKGVPETVIPAFANSYKVNNTFLLYFLVFPTLQLSGLMVSYSWMFSKRNEDENPCVDKNQMFLYLKDALVVIVVCLVLSIVANELVSPLLQNRQVSIKQASADYVEFSELAQEHLDSNNFAQAEMYAQLALRINPKSEDMQKLLSDLEIKSARTPPSGNEDPIFNPAVKINTMETNIPVGELIKRARSAYERGSYFEAHYYAMLALKTEDMDSDDLQEARTISAKAWEQLQVADSTLGGESESMYARKKAGYAAILGGDYLRAYYIFRNLFNEKGDDPDISRYLAIAQEELEKEYFFIDETYDLQPFENIRDVRFSVKKENGGLIVVAIRGMSHVSTKKQSSYYLRGTQIIVYNAQRNIEENFYIPYAKLLSVEAEKIGKEYEKIVEHERDTHVPYLIINSVEREIENTVIKPVYYASKSSVDEEKTVFVLPLPMNDFLQIADAAQGSKTMSLDSLAVFCTKAEKYGYPQNMYLQALCSRLCTPFLFVIYAMFAVILAWKFRLNKKQLVHFWWLLTVPFFSAVAYFIIKCIDHVHNLIIFMCVNLIGGFTLPVVILFYLFIFIMQCFTFISLNEE